MDFGYGNTVEYKESNEIESGDNGDCMNDLLDFNVKKDDLLLNIDDKDSLPMAVISDKRCIAESDVSGDTTAQDLVNETNFSNGSILSKQEKFGKSDRNYWPTIRSESVNSLSFKADAENTAICRVCMKLSDVLVSMFEKCPSESFFAPQNEMRQPDKVTGKANIWYDDQTIRDKIKFCSTVQVVETEELSSVICKPCLSDLMIAYRFKKRLEDSDELFRERLGLKNRTIVKTEFVLINCDTSDNVSMSSLEEQNGNIFTAKKRKKLKIKNKPHTKMKVEDVYSEDDDEKWPDKYKYKCSQCDRSFQYPSVLKIHEATHDRQNKKSTSERNKTSLPAKDRGRILVTPPPTEVKKTSTKLPVTPPTPESKQTSNSTLDTSKVKYDSAFSDHSAQSRESLKCGQCDRIFDKLRGLKLHEKSHTREKKHACDDCSERFSNAINLHMHRREMHTMRKCPKCDRIFKNRLSFVKHVDSHMSDKTIVKKVITEPTRVKSNTDLFKSIAPLTTTYWSDSYSD